MNNQKPSLRAAIIAALFAVAAAGGSMLLATPANAATTFPTEVRTIDHSPGGAGLNFGLASTEKFPGYPF